MEKPPCETVPKNNLQLFNSGKRKVAVNEEAQIVKHEEWPATMF